MSGRTRLVVMATAVTLACLPAAARADTTGNDLWRICTSKDARDNGLCYGYVTAIAEVIRQPAGLFGHHACLSDDTAIQQIVDVVKRYLDQHPEVRHYGSFGLLAPALSTKEPSGRAWIVAPTAAQQPSGHFSVCKATNSWTEGMSSTTTRTTMGEPATEETSELIASDKVEGTAVYNRHGERLGSVYNFMVNKRSGQVAYAVLSFGGFLGMGSSYHPLPWNELTYDTSLGGYVVNRTKEQLEGAPNYSASELHSWDDVGYRGRIDDYYNGLGSSRVTQP